MYRETPDQLAHFFGLSLDLFCVADSNGYFKIVNPAWKRTLGYSYEELLGQPYVNFVHPDDLGATVGAQSDLLHGNPVLDFQNRYRAKDGSWKWLDWKASPQPDGSIYAVARDITDQKEEEQAAKQLLWRLEKSNQELDQFAFIVSHDLKSPLRSIINLTEWIKEDLGDQLEGEIAQMFDLLQGRVGRMQLLVEDLLQYARTGRDDRPLELVDLNLLVAEVVAGIDRPAGFRILLPKPLEPIYTHQSEIFQLFQNLIGNAIKYRSNDQGMVEIQQYIEGGRWRFDFKDDGVGIDPKHHQRIFEVFQRLSTTEEVEGTGIGLALVKKIVEARGGRVWVESALGQGSTFSWTWPVHAE